MNYLADNNLFGLGSALLAPQTPPALPAVRPTPLRWLNVVPRFRALLDTIAISEETARDGEASLDRITATLNRHFWGHNDKVLNRIVGGSWGKQTRVRPTRDIDMLFLLPAPVFHQFQARSGNRQSQLLQHVKAVLAQTYTRTELRGDGQVVMVKMDHIVVEVVPAFRCDDGSLIICDANAGGRWKACTPEAEINDLAAAEARTGGTARHLARLAKLWARHVDAPIESFMLERLAVEFLQTWQWTVGHLLWYDWIVRDFFGYLVARANGFVVMPGTNEWVALGVAWLPKAKAAHNAASEANVWEDFNNDALALAAWRKLFGVAVESAV